MPSPTESRYHVALQGLVEQIRGDRSVLAAILCGSLSHDTVWAKSDIDLALVTADERKGGEESVSLYADGLNVHAFLFPRAQFRATVEGAVHNSFMHSFLAKGRLLYTHDETIAALCTRLQEIGGRDTQVRLLDAAAHAVGSLYKARKWLVTRGDLDYAALWILYAATPLAQLEVVGRRLVADREVIPQALTLNPAFFAIVYTELLNARKTRPRVEAALAAAEGYVAERARSLFAPVLEYLREAGEARSATEIERHFERSFGTTGVTVACEYLADQGIVAKVSTPRQITRRSNVVVQELAFVHVGE